MANKELGQLVRTEFIKRNNIYGAKEALCAEPLFYSADLTGLPFKARIVTAVQSRIDNPHGKSLGGLRVAPVEDPKKLAGDLAYAMTDKWVALEETLKQTGATPDEINSSRMGGGKSVLSVPSIETYNNLTPDQARTLFTQVGEFMEQNVKGNHITAVDMGTKTAHMDIVSEKTKFVACQSVEQGGTGSPSPATAHGVWSGARSLMREMKIDPSEAVYAVQGVGEVGKSLVINEILREFPNAQVYVSDEYSKANALRNDFPENLRVLPSDLFWQAPADVFMPCAVAGVVNYDALQEMQNSATAKLICGSANDQFPTINGRADMEVVKAYHEAGIVVAPDSLVNMGGILHIALGWGEGYRDEKGIVNESKLNSRAMKLVEGVGSVIQELHKEAEILNIPMEEVYRSFLENAYAQNRLSNK